MADIIIFGASYAARMMRIYLERHDDRRVLGYTVDGPYISAGLFDGRPVFPWEELEKFFPPGSVDIIGPVSHAGMNSLRKYKHAEAKKRGYSLASFIHPTAQIYSETLGEAAIILEYTVIQPGTFIGDGLILWSSSLIGHDCHIGNYCFLSGGVAVGGRTKLGNCSYLAGAANIKPGVNIGEETAILNGAFVATDLPEKSVVKGVHGKPMRVTSDRIHKILSSG